MTIAYYCILFMGLLPIVAAGIAKQGFDGYDNSAPRQWLAKQTGFRARANAAQANLFESLPLFFAAVIIASIAKAPQDRIDVLAMGFVIARVAYLICYVANWPTTRTIIWFFGIICVVALFFSDLNSLPLFNRDNYQFMTTKKLPIKKTVSKKRGDQEDVGTPLSVVIRRRIEAQKARFHANDNIAAFIMPGELEILVEEVAEKMQAVFESLVIDTENDHNTQNTSRRVAKMYVQEVFNGRYVDQPALTKFPNVSRLNELMIIGPITVRSACSHHLCPIMGRIWIGVLPSKDSALIGLSKYSRLTEWVMCRPQIQEEAVVELADMLEKKIKPVGVAVVMDADHFCMQWRGVKDRDSKMINSVMRGAFLKDSNLRREFLALIDRK